MDSLLDLFTVNGKGYSVKLTPCACGGVRADNGAYQTGTFEMSAPASQRDGP